MKKMMVRKRNKQVAVEKEEVLDFRRQEFGNVSLIFSAITPFFFWAQRRLSAEPSPSRATFSPSPASVVVGSSSFGQSQGFKNPVEQIDGATN